MTLKTVDFGENNIGNKFCGPSVMSAICGISTDDASRYICRAMRELGSRERIPTDPTKVIGCTAYELMGAFKRCGWKMNLLEQFVVAAEKKRFWDRMSLYRVVLKYKDKPGYYVMNVPGHWIAIEVDAEKKVYIVDSWTKEPLGVHNSSRLSQTVKGIWKVERMNANG